jgi:hypothetical protein
MTLLMKSVSRISRVFGGGGGENNSDHDARVASRLEAMTRAMANAQPVRRLF